VSLFDITGRVCVCVCARAKSRDHPQLINATVKMR